MISLTVDFTSSFLCVNTTRYTGNRNMAEMRPPQGQYHLRVNRNMLSRYRSVAYTNDLATRREPEVNSICQRHGVPSTDSRSICACARRQQRRFRYVPYVYGTVGYGKSGASNWRRPRVINTPARAGACRNFAGVTWHVANILTHSGFTYVQVERSGCFPVELGLLSEAVRLGPTNTR